MTIHTTTEKAEPPPGLLRLPIELCWEINKLVLSERAFGPSNEDYFSMFEPAITQVCQHIRDEVMTLYLASEDLIIDIGLSRGYMERFAGDLRDLAAAHGPRPFRDLHLRIDYDCNVHDLTAVLPLLEMIYETGMDLSLSREVSLSTREGGWCFCHHALDEFVAIVQEGRDDKKIIQHGKKWGDGHGTKERRENSRSKYTALFERLQKTWWARVYFDESGGEEEDWEEDWGGDREEDWEGW